MNRIGVLTILDLSDRSLTRLQTAEVLKPFEQGKGGRPTVYDLATVGPAYVRHLKATIPRTDNPDARARRDESIADLNELKLAERRQEVLPRQQVVDEGRAFVLAVRAHLLALPRRLVQMGHVVPERQPAVMELIHTALGEMSRWKNRLDCLEAAAAPVDGKSSAPSKGGGS
jgi:hypothetical protein